MVVEWTITLGNILTIAGFLVGGMGAFFAMRTDIRLLNLEVGGLKSQVEALKEILITLARQDERLKTMEAMIEDLRHGKGFTFDVAPSRHLVQPNAAPERKR